MSRHQLNRTRSQRSLKYRVEGTQRKWIMTSMTTVGLAMSVGTIQAQASVSGGGQEKLQQKAGNINTPNTESNDFTLKSNTKEYKQSSTETGTKGYQQNTGTSYTKEDKQNNSEVRTTKQNKGQSTVTYDQTEDTRNNAKQLVSNANQKAVKANKTGEQIQKQVKEQKWDDSDWQSNLNQHINQFSKDSDDFKSSQTGTQAAVKNYLESNATSDKRQQNSKIEFDHYKDQVNSFLNQDQKLTSIVKHNQTIAGYAESLVQAKDTSHPSALDKLNYNIDSINTYLEKASNEHHEDTYVEQLTSLKETHQVLYQNYSAMVRGYNDSVDSHHQININALDEHESSIIRTINSYTGQKDTVKKEKQHDNEFEFANDFKKVQHLSTDDYNKSINYRNQMGNVYNSLVSALNQVVPTQEQITGLKGAGEIFKDAHQSYLTNNRQLDSQVSDYRSVLSRYEKVNKTHESSLNVQHADEVLNRLHMQSQQSFDELIAHNNWRASAKQQLEFIYNKLPQKVSKINRAAHEQNAAMALYRDAAMKLDGISNAKETADVVEIVTRYLSKCNKLIRANENYIKTVDETPAYHELIDMYNKEMSGLPGNSDFTPIHDDLTVNLDGIKNTDQQLIKQVMQLNQHPLLKQWSFDLNRNNERLSQIFGDSQLLTTVEDEKSRYHPGSWSTLDQSMSRLYALAGDGLDAFFQTSEMGNYKPAPELVYHHQLMEHGHENGYHAVSQRPIEGPDRQTFFIEHHLNQSQPLRDVYINEKKEKFYLAGIYSYFNMPAKSPKEIYWFNQHSAADQLRKMKFNYPADPGTINRYVLIYLAIPVPTMGTGNTHDHSWWANSSHWKFKPIDLHLHSVKPTGKPEKIDKPDVDGKTPADHSGESTVQPFQPTTPAYVVPEVQPAPVMSVTQDGVTTNGSGEATQVTENAAASPAEDGSTAPQSKESESSDVKSEVEGAEVNGKVSEMKNETNSSEQTTLPQTDESSEARSASAVALATFGLLGALGLTRRQKKHEE